MLSFPGLLLLFWAVSITVQSLLFNLVLIVCTGRGRGELTVVVVLMCSVIQSGFFNTTFAVYVRRFSGRIPPIDASDGCHSIDIK